MLVSPLLAVTMGAITTSAASTAAEHMCTMFLIIVDVPWEAEGLIRFLALKAPVEGVVL